MGGNGNSGDRNNAGHKTSRSRARTKAAFGIIVGLRIAVALTMPAARRIERLAVCLPAPKIGRAAYATTINIGGVAVNEARTQIRREAKELVRPAPGDVS
jgi:hypothetical protein